MARQADFTTEIATNDSLPWINETRTDDVEKDYFSTWIVWVSTTVAISSSVLGGIGSATTIFAYKRNRKLQTSFNHLVLNQCVLDLFFSLLIKQQFILLCFLRTIMTVTVGSYYAPNFTYAEMATLLSSYCIILPFIIPLVIMQFQIYSEKLCEFVDYLYHAMTSASVINLVFIAINRYVGIVHSSRYRRLYSSKEMRRWLIAAWTSSPLLYLPFILSAINNDLCTIGSQSFKGNLNIYNLVLQNLLKLLPTVVLIILYRAIFMKVKKSRKVIEDHPMPGSVSHTNMDADFDGSSRLRTMRRQSSSRIRRTESLNTQKASGSPKNGNKSNTMAYLQVPDAKSVANLDFNSEQDFGAKNKSYLIKASSSQSLDSQCTSNVALEVIRSVQSTPEIYVENNFKDDSVSSNVGHYNGDATINDETVSLATSERQRRRMQDMRNLHIMSTIDSESYSKSVSCENADYSILEEKATKENLQINESDAMSLKPSNNGTLAVQSVSTPSENNSAASRKHSVEPKFYVGELIQNQNYLMVGVLPLSEKIFEARPKTVTSGLSELTSGLTASQDQISIKIDDENRERKRHLLQPHCGNLRRLHSMSCADIPDDGGKMSRVQKAEDISRRHSISACSDCKSDYDSAATTNKAAVGRKTLFKTYSRKRKKHHCPVSEQSKTNESFAGRRVKSETSRTLSRSWKRHWRRKTNPPNIKIVIEQATSEDTVPDPSESMRFYINNYEEINEAAEAAETASKDQESNSSPKKILKAKTDSLKNSFKKSFMKRTNSGKSYFEAQATVGSEIKLKSAKSTESLPSQFQMSDRHAVPSKCQKSQNDNNNFLQPHKCNGAKLTKLTHEASVEASETKRTPNMDERRSSITSNVYRYQGNDDNNLSRNGSFSHTSFVDDCRRRNNNSPMHSRQNSASRRNGKRLERKSSFYNWNRRRSFFSSFNSSNTTDSRRQRRRRDAEKHIAYNGIVICVAFAVIVLPSYIVGILNNIVRQSADAHLIVAMLSWLHVVINPTIYGYMNPQFRAEYKLIWRKATKNCTGFIGNCKKPDTARKTSTASNCIRN